MLYGVHVFARAKVIPDLAVARGREAHERARQLGDRSLEFLAAGGTAMAHSDLGDLTEAKRWIERAAAVAATAPTPARARQLELWRGLLAGAAGDLPGLHLHMRQALDLAASPDRRAARCEILAADALECARLGSERADAGLLEKAEALAGEARRLVVELPGRPPWAAQADTALAMVFGARNDPVRALEHARAALAFRHDAMREDPHLEILLPAAGVVLTSGEEAEQVATRSELQLLAGLIGQRTLDEDVRATWWRRPVGQELARLAGTGAPSATATSAPAPTLDEAARGDVAASDAQRRLLGLILEGRTNDEIAEELGVSPESVGQVLATMYARIGATSRSEATVFALSARV
jgi:DNA-binding CsgD family transcriptional regulator